MKSLFAIGASALVMGLASVGGAQAQSLGATIGGDLLAVQNQFSNGNWVNESINIGAINGAVTLGQAGAEVITNVDLPNVALNIEAASGLGVAVLPPALALANAGEIGLNVDLGSVASQVRTLGGIDSLSEIKTTVVGAVNTGDIASAVSTVSAATSNSTTLDTGSISATVSSSAQAAANTSNTASSSAASQLASLDLQGPSSTVTTATEALVSGPLLDVYATNRAFNSGPITGSVTGIANDMNLNGISTTVVGAVNTGTISQGFNGAAFAASLPN
ncbi:hypothetical protein [Aureimonas sp. AU12]|uniref:hypothetical protein n=1 Tax=Aureimonas sp. AU12 TaxID=1638161 RepID=UPI00078164DD|nr:hypothetical protein [Aureimonas sp. AU12]